LSSLEIRYNPKFAEINSLTDIKLENGSNPLTLASMYHSNKFEMKIIEGTMIKFDYSIQNSSIVYKKNIIDSSTFSDIYFLYFMISSNNVELTKIHDPFLVYSKNPILMNSRKQFHQ
jgi:hypothetical protein